jgi:hypothetical protein
LHSVKNAIDLKEKSQKKSIKKTKTSNTHKSIPPLKGVRGMTTLSTFIPPAPFEGGGVAYTVHSVENAIDLKEKISKKASKRRKRQIPTNPFPL